MKMAGPDLDLTKRPGGGAIDLENLKRRSWPGITAHFVRFAAPTTYNFRIDKSTHYIALHEMYRADGETSAPGIPRSYVKDLRNKLTFSPLGCDVEGWSHLVKPGSFTALHLAPSDNAAEAIDLAKLAPQISFEDQALRMALLRFQVILHDPLARYCTPGYAESPGRKLVAFESRSDRPSRAASATSFIEGGLTARQVTHHRRLHGRPS